MVLLLGAVDTGKSTLAMYLVGELLRAGLKTAYLDADVGQAALGLPGTVSVRVFSPGVPIKGAPRPEAMAFVGGINPARHIPAVAEAAKRMARFALERGAERIIVDTSGLVSGAPGLRLKAAKLRALAPSDVVAVARAGELDEVLSTIKGPRVHRLAVPARARQRSRAERMGHRRERFAAYLKGARGLRLAPGEARWTLAGPREAPLSEAPAPGTVVGLLAGGRTLALGVLEEFSPGGAVIRTPLRAKGRIGRVAVGDFAVDLSPRP
ncbi:MAG: hypothetical protein Kow0025_13570 [Thermodesulfovibrionales bacterium]